MSLIDSEEKNMLPELGCGGIKTITQGVACDIAKHIAHDVGHLMW
ncbi:MAG: hypothetical protein ACRDDA_10025 [Aeromonas sp.]